MLVDKTAEKALAESDHHLRSFTDSRLVLIRVMDVDQRLNYVNGGWLAFTGLTEQQALAGDSWQERLHPGEARRVLQAFADAFGRREAFRMDYRLRRHDGEYRWIRDESTPYWDSSGHFDGFVSHCQDIHDLVQAQMEQARLSDELRLNEERLRLAMEATQDGLWDWNLQTGKVYYSASWFRILGYDPDEFGDRANTISLWTDLNHPDERETMVQKAQVLLETEGRHELVFRLLAKDGNYRWINSRGKVVERGLDGAPLRAIGTHIDITEHKEAEDKILALNASLEQKVLERTAQLVAESAAKSEFLAHMSHEIRTPLNAVIGFAQVLEREFLTKEQLNFVLQIRESGQSLLHIINDILDFSKIEAGQLRIERVPFVLESLLNPVKDLLWSSAENRGIRLNVETPASIPGRLLGDDLRIRQVLINLLSNAIKFTEKGQVDLRVVQLVLDDHQVRLRFEVRDTGIGISPPALSRLFQPFSQADGSITRRFGGTGLGLTIRRRLVEMMSGTIGADSVPGEGSTFWFELPLQRIGEEEESIQPVTPTLPACHRLHGMRVLVVDDNRMNLLLVESALKKENVETVLAGDGQQALEILRSQPQRFQAVLMDVQMPVMDGLTATRAIRNDPALSHLPVIALTAGVMPQERQAALEAGVNNFLSKPLELGQLLGVLEQCWQA
ncbi:MAG: PAS domain-containing protein [Methylococcus sp.]